MVPVLPFATSTAMATIYNRYNNFLSSDPRHITLSPQYFMDCIGRTDCCGTYKGLVSIYAEYKIVEDKNDLFPKLEEYPYLNYDQKCPNTIFNVKEKCYELNENNSIHIGHIINRIETLDYSNVPKNRIIRELNTYGPMVVTIIINSKALLFSFAFYSKGIIKDSFPFGMGGRNYYDSFGGHSLVLYGYEVRKYHYPSWVLRNSWGVDAPTVLIDAKENNAFGIFDEIIKFYHVPQIVLPNN